MTFVSNGHDFNLPYDEDDPDFSAPARHIAHFINRRTVEDALATTWHDFAAQAEIAQYEAKRYGEPSSETSSALSYLSDTITLLEQRLTQALAPAGSLFPDERKGELRLNGQRYSYATGTAEQARFLQVLRGGVASLPEWARDRVRLADAQWLDEHKAMTEANDVTGGYLASPEFSADLLRAMQESSPIRQVATVQATGGTGLFIPVRTDVQAATRVSEVATRAADATQDIDLRAETIPVHEAFCLTAVSRALLADSRYDLAAELVNAARVAFSKLEGTESVTGDGNGKFRGLNNTTLASGNIVTSTDSSGHSVLDTDLAKLLFETVNAAYLPGARLLLNKKTLGKFRQLKATSGNSLFFPVADMPGTLAGVPYVLMPDMDEVGAASRNVVYLLSPSAYAVAQRMDINVIRAPELYAEAGKVLFYIYLRSGGQAVLPDGIGKIVTA